MSDITGKEYIYGLAQDKNGAPYLFNIGELVRCKYCKWYGHIGCAIRVVDDSDKPKANDYCSWGERKEP